MILPGRGRQAERRRNRVLTSSKIARLAMADRPGETCRDGLRGVATASLPLTSVMDCTHAQSWRRITTPLAVGVTDSDGPDEGQTVLIWTHHTGERLTFYPGWHLLPLPALGEPVAAYRDRAIFGHPLVRDILTRGAMIRGGLKLPTLDGAHPAERTLEWWRKAYPHREFHWETEMRRQALGYHLKRIVWRLVVELYDRARAGDLVAEGRRIDVAGGQPAVSPDLWSNPDMVLRPSSGVFRPEQRPGQPAPGPSLPSFIELTLAAPGATSSAKWPIASADADSKVALVPEAASPTSEPPGEQAVNPAAKRACWEALVNLQRGKDKVASALIVWAAKFGKDVPGRDKLLEEHRTEFGAVRGINGKTMGSVVRKALASDESKRGGAGLHKKGRQT